MCSVCRAGAATACDRFRRWPEAFPVEDISAETVARTIYAGWIARFGTPLRITSDQGRQFEADLFRELANLVGMKHLRTTAYHPAANGLVENSHRQLKAAIKCHTSSDWTTALPTVLIGMRSAWKDDVNTTSAELVYGEPLRLPGQFLAPHRVVDDACDPNSLVARLKRHFEQLQPVPASRHGTGRPFIFKDLQTTSHVFVRVGATQRPLDQPYEGPYPVISRHEKFYVVRVRGKDRTITIERLKPAYVATADDERPPPTPSQSSDLEHQREQRIGNSNRRVRFEDGL